MKLAIACDHAGYQLKEYFKEYFKNLGSEIFDFGTFSEESCDYPDFAHPLAKSVNDYKFDFGISICGSGNGINMVVNKYSNVRGALCWNQEIAKLARLHNNANICALPARFISQKDAEEIINTFISTEFEGGRHQKRIDKIPLK